MISIDEAFRIVDEALRDIKLASEIVPTRAALGRVVLSDQRSYLNLPPFDKSAVDGYAVLPDDERGEYRLLETVAAGQVAKTKLISGTAIKVMTGAAVPEGAGRVIMIEHTEEREGVVKVLKHDSASNICKKGEDIHIGDLIVSAGTMLRPVEIANLIACGITEVEATRPIRMAIISTGDEIVDSPNCLAPGKIMNSNGPMLAALAKDSGIEIVSETTVPDDKEATESAIRTEMERADLVILSGGVSVGEFDHVLSALHDLGLKVHFSRLAVQPGKPTVFAAAPGKAVFGLPGNPVSAYLMFHLLVLRAAALMAGRTPSVRQFRLRLAAEFKRRKTERQAFVPCRLTEDGAVEPITYHGSAHLAALMNADGFFVVPVGVGELRQGEEVTFIPISRGWQW